MFGKIYLNVKKGYFLRAYLNSLKMLKQSHHLQNNILKNLQDCKRLKIKVLLCFAWKSWSPKNIIQNQFVPNTNEFATSTNALSAFTIGSCIILWPDSSSAQNIKQKQLLKDKAFKSPTKLKKTMRKHINAWNLKTSTKWILEVKLKRLHDILQIWDCLSQSSFRGQKCDACLSVQNCTNL